MAKKKASIRYGKLLTSQKTVTTIDKQELSLHLQRRHFKKPLYLKPGIANKQVLDLINTKVRPEFERFFKNTRGKGKGDKYIFSLMTGMNFSGKRVKHGFSTKRWKIKSLKNFDKVIDDLLNQAKSGFLVKLQKYLARQGLTSFSIRGVKMEVAKLHAPKRKKAAKTKSRPAKRSKR